MMSDFNNILNFSLTFSQVAANLTVALISGIIISIFYKKTYNGPGYLTSFLNSLILLSLITAIVIMVIGNNLARAFGLVGAMSIIRFRTAVKETQDIIFIFFSLAIGMAAGVGHHTMAIFGSVFIGFVALVMSKTKFSTPVKPDLLLQFTFNANGRETTEYNSVIDKYCRKIKLINAKAIGEGDLMEFSYYIGFKDKKESTNFVKEMKKVNGISHVNLFFDEEYF